MTSDALGLLRSRVHRVLERHGCRTTDHFAGFQITGRFHVAELVELIAIAARRQHGIHVPSRPLRRGVARRAHRLKESREQELEALVAPEVKEALERNGVELVNYAGIG